MNISLQICVDYLQMYVDHCQQPEALLSWKIAAGFCATLVWIRIGFWLYEKCMECENSDKGIWYLIFMKHCYTRKDEEYNGCMKYFYMFKYLSYYSFFVLIMSRLEYIIEDRVGPIARLEMWGIVSIFFGGLISFLIWKGITWVYTRYKKEKWVSDLRGWILKDGKSFAFMMVASETRRGSIFRIAVYIGRLIPLSFMIFIHFTLARYFIYLDINGAIIVTAISVFIVLRDWVIFFIRKDEIEYFKEQE